MSKIAKYSAAILLVLLTMMTLTSALTAFAQDEEPIPPPEDQTPPPIGQLPPSIQLPQQDVLEAFVTVLASVGGTTSPAPGATYRYESGVTIELTAVPFQGFKFAYWTIAGQVVPGHNVPPIVYPEVPPEDFIPDVPVLPTLPDPTKAQWDSLVVYQNPLKISCGYGYNYQYQAVFVSTATPTPGNNTIVTLVDALGGTSTITAGGVSKTTPGTYTYAAGQTIKLEATAATDYAFSYWIVKGSGDLPDDVIVENPIDLTCQEGTAYSYQPVFVPHNAPGTEQGIADIYWIAIVVVLVIVAVIGLGVALMYRSRGKK